MKFMSVTLDVSRLSGWSNADAPCVPSRKGGIRSGGEASQEAEGGGATAAQVNAGEGPNWGSGVHARSAPKA